MKLFELFYAVVYHFYRQKMKEDEFMSWFYSIFIIGFLLSINFLSIIHFLFGSMNISVNKTVYLVLFSSPQVINLIYFYFIRPNKKNAILIRFPKPPSSKKWIFILYFIFSKVALIASVIYYGMSFDKT